MNPTAQDIYAESFGNSESLRGLRNEYALLSTMDLFGFEFEGKCEIASLVHQAQRISPSVKKGSSDPEVLSSEIAVEWRRKMKA